MREDALSRACPVSGGSPSAASSISDWEGAWASRWGTYLPPGSLHCSSSFTGCTALPFAHPSTRQMVHLDVGQRKAAGPPAQRFQRGLCTGPARKQMGPGGSCQFPEYSKGISSVCLAGQIRRNPATIPPNKNIRTPTRPLTAASLLVLLVLPQRNIISSFTPKTSVWCSRYYSPTRIHNHNLRS